MGLAQESSEVSKIQDLYTRIKNCHKPLYEAPSESYKPIDIENIEGLKNKLLLVLKENNLKSLMLQMFEAKDTNLNIQTQEELQCYCVITLNMKSKIYIQMNRVK